MSVDNVQLWSVLGEQIKSSLFFVLDENDETVVKMMAPVAMAGIQDFALLKGKDRWDPDDIEPYIAAFWENIKRIPRLLRLRKEITEAMKKELMEILRTRKPLVQQ